MHSLARLLAPPAGMLGAKILGVCWQGIAKSLGALLNLPVHELIVELALAKHSLLQELFRRAAMAPAQLISKTCPLIGLRKGVGGATLNFDEGYWGLRDCAGRFSASGRWRATKRCRGRNRE